MAKKKKNEEGRFERFMDGMWDLLDDVKADVEAETGKTIELDRSKHLEYKAAAARRREQKAARKAARHEKRWAKVDRFWDRVLGPDRNGTHVYHHFDAPQPVQPTEVTLRVKVDEDGNIPGYPGLRIDADGNVVSDIPGVRVESFEWS